MTIAAFAETMPGGEVALIVSSIIGGFTVLGGMIAVIVNALVNARTKSMQADFQHLRDVFNVQQQSNNTTIEGFRETVKYLQGQIREQGKENQALHDADLESRKENNLLRNELETVRKDNQILRSRVEQQDLIISEQARQIVGLQNENADLKVKNSQQEQAMIDMRTQLEKVKKQTGGLGNG